MTGPGVAAMATRLHDRDHSAGRLSVQSRPAAGSPPSTSPRRRQEQGH
ncbi:hypothetical protein HGI15_17270 [Modestobacter lapidis]|nr:hypothetical protein [Modestobacter lapidis]